MQVGFPKWFTRGLIAAAFVVFAFHTSDAYANARVKKATSWYLKGNNLFNAKKYGQAVGAFRKAYSLLPRHPHFNCHRAQFLNYMGRAYESMRRPHNAMKTYYQAAYRVGCKTATTRNYAAGRYRYLYGRWMCSIQIKTTPPKARVYLITPTGDKKLGRTPFKKVFSPGKYNFKIRLYDHRTIFYKVDLRPGRHLKRTLKMVKGDDPVTRVEKVDVAPPVPMASLSKAKDKKTASKDPNKIDLGSFASPNASTGGSGGLDSRGRKTASAGSSGDLVSVTATRKKVKNGPPVYKQAWFWAVIGGVAAAAVIIPIVVPKEQKALVSQGKMF